MKTNTFIFNFINPSRLVNFASAPVEGPRSEGPKAPETTKSEDLRQAEEKYNKAWGKVLEEKAKLQKAQKSEDIAKCVKSLAEAKVQFDKAGYDFSTLIATENAKEREARSKDLIDPWAEKKVVFAEDPLGKGGFSTKNPYEDEPEIIKANPKTKKAIEALLTNPSDTLKNFLTADHTGKNWKELNKEFLAVLGITGGSERSHIKALQDVLFGENVRDSKATDGKLGKYTLAKLQEKLGVVPQQNLEGGSYNDRLIVFLNKRVDFSQVPAENLAKLTDKKTTAEQKIAILKKEMGRQRNMDEKRVDNMLAQAFKPETAQTLIASAEPQDWEKFEGQSIPPVEEITFASAEPEDWEKFEGQSIPPVEGKTAVANNETEPKELGRDEFIAIMKSELEKHEDKINFHGLDILGRGYFSERAFNSDIPHTEEYAKKIVDRLVDEYKGKEIPDSTVANKIIDSIKKEETAIASNKSDEKKEKKVS